VQNQLTEQLTQQLEESKYLHIPLMNRIEGRIRTEEQLAKYTAVLVQKARTTGVSPTSGSSIESTGCLISNSA
jgi:hypothetical protein